MLTASSAPDPTEAWILANGGHRMTADERRRQIKAAAFGFPKS